MHYLCIEGQFLGTRFQERNNLLIGRKPVANIHVMLSQYFVLLGDQKKPNREKINFLKNNGFVLAVFLYVFDKVCRHIRPMLAWVQVMANVVAIVEAPAVVAGVDAGDAVLVGVGRVARVDERRQSFVVDSIAKKWPLLQ